MSKYKSQLEKFAPYFPWALLFITILLYARGIFNDFIYNWDDAGYVLKNDYIKEISWENIKAIFTTFYMSNYHPLTMLSYMLDYAIAGYQPWWYHFVNILFHAVNTLLVYAFIRKFTSYSFIAFGVALLFAVHPMHVESVAWISERKDVLYVFFFLLGLLAYLRYLNSRKWTVWSIITLFFLLSLLSKSAAVVFPVICFVLDWLTQRKWHWNIILEKLPWLAASIAFGILAILSQEQAIQDLQGKLFWWEQLFIVNYAVLLYLLKFFIPFQLSAFHPYPLKMGTYFSWYIYALGLVTILLVGLWYAFGRKNRMLNAGLLFFFVALAPMMQLIPVGGAMMAERYTYLPYVGLSLPIVAWLHQQVKLQRSWLLWLSGAWMVYLIIVTYDRISYWKDGDVLFTDVVSKYPMNPFAWTNRGFLYWDDYALKKYKHNEIKKAYYVQKAYHDFTQAIQLDTTFYQAYMDRAILLYNTGRPEEALHDFNKLLSLQPHHKDGLLGRANTLSTLGRYAEALPDYNAYLRLQPADAKALLWRAIAYVKTQQPEKALPDLYTSRKLSPDDYEIYYWLGLAHYHTNQMDSAIHYFLQVEQMKPQFAELYDWTALAFQAKGNYEKALQYYQRAIELNPSNCVSLVNRSSLYYTLKKFKEAYQDLEQAKQKGCFVPAQLELVIFKAIRP